ncbi:hypothetical protein SLEP1_g28136 [Rubroshorea leprosula]|uniref:Uncharacterized protein n=1 Tax=Rubroshorea leprosula TaxID=152421 RepID=A0AAV5K560_9ROSI|nr:hypothetical protein SLEP1_g28136 [Rubroshorea leprosula]
MSRELKITSTKPSCYKIHQTIRWKFSLSDRLILSDRLSSVRSCDRANPFHLSIFSYISWWRFRWWCESCFEDGVRAVIRETQGKDARQSSELRAYRTSAIRRKYMAVTIGTSSSDYLSLPETYLSTLSQGTCSVGTHHAYLRRLLR